MARKTAEQKIKEAQAALAVATMKATTARTCACMADTYRELKALERMARNAADQLARLGDLGSYRSNVRLQAGRVEAHLLRLEALEDAQRSTNLQLKRDTMPTAWTALQAAMADTEQDTLDVLQLLQQASEVKS